jgi:hypothetical protein
VNSLGVIFCGDVRCGTDIYLAIDRGNHFSGKERQSSGLMDRQQAIHTLINYLSAQTRFAGERRGALRRFGKGDHQNKW